MGLNHFGPYFLITVFCLLVHSGFASANVCNRSDTIVLALEVAVNKDCDAITDADLAKIDVLDLKQEYYEYSAPVLLKAGDLDGLANLVDLDITLGRIGGVLSAEQFRGAEKLKRIELRGNDLTEIANHTFDKLTELEYIGLAANQLTVLKPELFTILLPKLKLVEIYSNGLSEENTAALIEALGEERVYK